jgi:hypothetical protein
MKYVLFIYQPKNFNPKSLSENEYKEVAAQYAALNDVPKLRAGLACGFPQEAKTVRVRDGETVTTPGPYVEQLGGAVGGYLEFDAETEEEAIRLAARIPAARLGGAIEIRPSKVYW